MASADPDTLIFPAPVAAGRFMTNNNNFVTCYRTHRFPLEDKLNLDTQSGGKT